jgi:hypothetical protein
VSDPAGHRHFDSRREPDPDGQARESGFGAVDVGAYERQPALIFRNGFE